jgi:uncharacterized protein YodC (DUF2158 family)
MGFKYTAGTVVRLRSKGPAMTVAGQKDDVVTCVWYCNNENIYKERDFSPASLTIITGAAYARGPIDEADQAPAWQADEDELHQLEF